MPDNDYILFEIKKAVKLPQVPNENLALALAIQIARRDSLIAKMAILLGNFAAIKTSANHITTTCLPHKTALEIKAAFYEAKAHLEEAGYE